MHFHTTSYRLHSTWPTDLPLADTSVASSKNVFHEALHLSLSSNKKQSPHFNSTSGSDIHDGRAEVVFFYSVYRFFS